MTRLQSLHSLTAGVPGAVAVAHGEATPASSSFSVDPAARFQACSISKPVGAVTALSLVADGLLGLDDDVSPLLKSWTIPKLGDWQPVVTLRHLLSHSAGMTVHGFPGYPRTQPAPGLVEILQGNGNTPAVTIDVPPGLVARYSGGGYVALQVLLEDLTGRPFATLAQERVLRPAGMTDSGYSDPPLAAPALRPAGRPVPDGPHQYPELVGGLWTTPADLVLFAQAVQQQVLLPAQLNTELLTEQLPGWGLGMALLPGGVFGHSGANEGYRCRLVAARDGTWSAAVMTGSDAGGRVCNQLLNRLAETEGWAQWQALPVQQKVCAWSAQLPGAYCDERGRVWTVSRRPGTGADGDLQLTLPGQGPVGLELTGQDSCLIPAWDGALTLAWDQGAITAVELRQAGLGFRAIRTEIGKAGHGGDD